MAQGTQNKTKGTVKKIIPLFWHIKLDTINHGTYVRCHVLLWIPKTRYFCVFHFRRSNVNKECIRLTPTLQPPPPPTPPSPLLIGNGKREYCPKCVSYSSSCPKNIHATHWHTHFIGPHIMMLDSLLKTKRSISRIEFSNKFSLFVVNLNKKIPAGSICERYVTYTMVTEA